MRNEKRTREELEAIAKTLPTVFRGCHWDDGWEFDGPTVIYDPWSFRAYSPNGSNDGHIDYLFESLTIDLVVGLENGKSVAEILSSYNNDLDGEMKWRGWGRGFSRRKKACHRQFEVEWFVNDDNELDIKILATKDIES